MKIEIGLWLVVIGLVGNAVYQGYLGVEHTMVSPFVWAAVCLSGAWGLIRRRIWSRSLIFLLCAFSIAS